MTEQAIQLALVGVLSLFLGVLIGAIAAYLKAQKKQKALETELNLKSSDTHRLENELTQNKDALEKKVASLHELEITQKELETKYTSVEKECVQVKDSLEQSRFKLDAESKSLAQVNSSLASMQSNYKAEQAKSNQLDERLNEKNTTVSTLRGQLDQEKIKSSETAEKAKASQVEAQELRVQLEDVKIKLNEEVQKHTELAQRYQSLDKKQAEQLKTMEERQASHQREVANFEKQKESLSEQFKVLSNEILEAKTKSLQENSKVSFNAILNPFQQSIDSFKKEVQEIHHRETTQQGELRKELESLKELNHKITTEAHELSTALRGQKKLQGNWGELVLENVLERSGLQLGKDYQREMSITTEEGRLRPDAVVFLPQDKHLIIDAKVSLNAYTDYVNGEDETERSLSLNKHVEAVRARIKELSDKDYYKLPGLNSPEMVFMFIPIESAFVEALKADEKLFQTAIENNVLVATPTTLLTSLNIVRQLWRYEDQNKHTAALAQKAEGVFKKLNSFLGNFENIKKSLDKATEAYTKAEGQLVSGRGNLVKQVGEFKNLAPAIKAELPSYFTEKAELEIDFIPAENSEDVSAEPALEQPEKNKTPKENDLFIQE